MSTKLTPRINPLKDPFNPVRFACFNWERLNQKRIIYFHKLLARFLDVKIALKKFWPRDPFPPYTFVTFDFSFDMPVSAITTNRFNLGFNSPPLGLVLSDHPLRDIYSQKSIVSLDPCVHQITAGTEYQEAIIEVSSEWFERSHPKQRFPISSKVHIPVLHLDPNCDSILCLVTPFDCDIRFSVKVTVQLSARNRPTL